MTRLLRMSSIVSNLLDGLSVVLPLHPNLLEGKVNGHTVCLSTRDDICFGI
jgi:hypothetical protein